MAALQIAKGTIKQSSKIGLQVWNELTRLQQEGSSVCMYWIPGKNIGRSVRNQIEVDTHIHPRLTFTKEHMPLLIFAYYFKTIAVKITRKTKSNNMEYN